MLDGTTDFFAGQCSEQKLRVVGGGGGGVIICKMSGVTHVPIIGRHIYL